MSQNDRPPVDNDDIRQELDNAMAILDVVNRDPSAVDDDTFLRAFHILLARINGRRGRGPRITTHFRHIPEEAGRRAAGRAPEATEGPHERIEAQGDGDQGNEEDDIPVLRPGDLFLVEQVRRRTLRFGVDDRVHETPEARDERVCVSCMSEAQNESSHRCPCSHIWCRDCIVQRFELAIRNASMMPAQCCRLDMLPDNDPSIDPELWTRYLEKKVEAETPNPTYCSKPKCSMFVPPRNITEARAKCVCGRLTCAACNAEWHAGECVVDPATEEILKMSQEESWQRCFHCKVMVERIDGCNELACTCGAVFCYACGKQWKTCRCRRFANIPEDSEASEDEEPSEDDGDGRGLFVDTDMAGEHGMFGRFGNVDEDNDLAGHHRLNGHGDWSRENEVLSPAALATLAVLAGPQGTPTNASHEEAPEIDVADNRNTVGVVNTRRALNSIPVRHPRSAAQWREAASALAWIQLGPFNGHRWVRIGGGGRCHTCRSRLPHFVYRCSTCRHIACLRCMRDTAGAR
ncbi:hypothetical protein diail_11135 [Diaporthe ilicicola]|nr:hypothetical protein diail_11135 [Diaporthe ilicicola]